MQLIPLQSIPRQQFTITLENSRFDITLLAIGGCMYATILRDEVEIVSGGRCINGQLVIPFAWLEGAAGNFAFSTNGEDMPWWDQFNTTQNLYYLLSTELAQIRAGL